jgi:signal transduction histidine kinase
MTTDHSEWSAVLGHELRSPVAAILGYQELLSEGTFGPLTPDAADAIRRIGFAAEQLLLLIDAIEPGHDEDERAEPVGALDVIDGIVTLARLEAEGRGVSIDVAPDRVGLVTRRGDAARALALMLGAAVKVSPGASLRVAASDGSVPRITVSGASLDPERDRIDHDAPLTPAALRLQLARVAAARAGGSVDIDPSGAVHLVLPRLAETVIDGAEHLP